jgi:diphosphomevalonate decarboxylase
MVVALTASGPKSVGSTEGMQRTAATSPYYRAWVEGAPRVFETVRAAVLARDLAALGAAVEQSALMMHASMLAADPALVYLSPASLAAMETVRGLRTSKCSRRPRTPNPSPKRSVRPPVSSASS